MAVDPRARSETGNMKYGTILLTGKDCRSDDFVKQKLDYMHHNFCKEKWKMAPCPKEHKHTSAHFYLAGEKGYYPITSYMELKDINLSQLVE